MKKYLSVAFLFVYLMTTVPLANAFAVETKSTSAVIFKGNVAEDAENYYYVDSNITSKGILYSTDMKTKKAEIDDLKEVVKAFRSGGLVYKKENDSGLFYCDKSGKSYDITEATRLLKDTYINNVIYTYFLGEYDGRLYIKYEVYLHSTSQRRCQVIYELDLKNNIFSELLNTEKNDFYIHNGVVNSNYLFVNTTWNGIQRIDLKSKAFKSLGKADAVDVNGSKLLTANYDEKKKATICELKTDAGIRILSFSVPGHLEANGILMKENGEIVFTSSDDFKKYTSGIIKIQGKSVVKKSAVVSSKASEFIGMTESDAVFKKAKFNFRTLKTSYSSFDSRTKYVAPKGYISATYKASSKLVKKNKKTSKLTTMLDNFTGVPIGIVANVLYIYKPGNNYKENERIGINELYPSNGFYEESDGKATVSVTSITKYDFDKKKYTTIYECKDKYGDDKGTYISKYWLCKNGRLYYTIYNGDSHDLSHESLRCYTSKGDIAVEKSENDTYYLSVNDSAIVKCQPFEISYKLTTGSAGYQTIEFPQNGFIFTHSNMLEGYDKVILNRQRFNIIVLDLKTKKLSTLYNAESWLDLTNIIGCFDDNVLLISSLNQYSSFRILTATETETKEIFRRSFSRSGINARLIMKKDDELLFYLNQRPLDSAYCADTADYGSTSSIIGINVNTGEVKTYIESPQLIKYAGKMGDGILITYINGRSYYKTIDNVVK